MPYPTSDQNLTLETEDAVYFFSHAFDPLNNWSAHQIKIWGKTFPTIEHAYHWRKFSESLPEAAQKIINAPSPLSTQQIAKEYKEQRRAGWDDIKVGIMEEIVRAKALQNDDVKDCLLGTGQKQIVENSPWDDFWGIGRDGKGQNQMGKILMRIREELRKEQK